MSTTVETPEILNLPTRDEVLRQAEAQRVFYSGLFENGNTPSTPVSTPTEGSGQIWETDILIEDPVKASRTKAVFQRYIDNGLNIAKKAPTRVERTAAAIVESVDQLTLKKVKEISVNAVKSYGRNIDIRRLKTEDRFFRYGYGIGAGMSFIVSATGLGFIPGNGLLRTGVGLGLIYGLSKSVDVERAFKKGKIEKEFFGDDAKIAEEMAKLDDIQTSYRAQLNSARDGLKAGGVTFATGRFLSHILEAPVEHLIREGVKMVDWTAISNEAGKVAGLKLKVGNVDINRLNPSNMVKSLENEVKSHLVTQVEPPKKLIQTDASLLNPAKVVEQPISVVAVEVKPGFEVTEKVFGTMAKADEVTHEYVSSTEGYIQDNIARYDYGIKDFDPKNVEHLKKFQAEMQADPEYQNKLKAGINAFMKLNHEQLDAFLPDPKTGAIGETFSYLDVDNNPLPLKTYQDWGEYFKSGAYKQDIDGNAQLKFVNESYKEVIEPFKGEDPVFKDWTREMLGNPTLQLEDGQVIEFQPGQVSSIKGLAEALYARDYLGIKNFNPGNDEHMKLFWEATATESPTRDFLAQARIKTIADKFITDNPTAMIHGHMGDQEVTTDYFSRVDQTGQPAKWKMLENYHSLAASLVDESPARDAFNGMDKWSFQNFDGEGYSLRGFAEAIFIKEDLGFADFDPNNPQHMERVWQLLHEKYGNDPQAMERKVNILIQYIKENNPGLNFNGDEIVDRSTLTGRINRLKLLRTFVPVLEAVKA